MLEGDLEITNGAAVGGWIKAGIGGKFGSVTCQVPKGYEAYARVFHPAFDGDLKPLSWIDTADALGTTAHPEMQWYALLGFSDAGQLRAIYEPESWIGSKGIRCDPPTGGMDLAMLDVLCRILARYTEDVEHSFFGLCTIQGWLDSIPPNELKPFLTLPMGRDYIVLAGRLASVDQISREWFGLHHGDQARREAPNLIWSADRSWLVASEVDFDSTLIGGSAELIEAIVGSPEIESFRVEPSTSLAEDADKVNLLIGENT